MDDVWKNLPYDMVREILKYSDDIDVRIAFKILPGKIDEAKVWRLGYLLNSHDGLVYNIDSKTLHCFEYDMYSNRRPISLRWPFIFNQEQAPHNLEIVRADGSCTVTPGVTDYIFTQSRILLRGSGIDKKNNYINTNGSME